jgi:hypothetical protein
MAKNLSGAAAKISAAKISAAKISAAKVGGAAGGAKGRGCVGKVIGGVVAAALVHHRRRGRGLVGRRRGDRGEPTPLDKGMHHRRPRGDITADYVPWFNQQ